MKQEETLEYNKRCAEFLGAKLGKGGTLRNPCYTGVPINRDGNVQTWTLLLKEMRFHSDWNWIMEVVEAIDKITQINIYKCECSIAKKVNSEYFKGYGNSKKEAVVKAINQFLIWYKNNTIQDNT